MQLNFKIMEKENNLIMPRNMSPKNVIRFAHPDIVLATFFPWHCCHSKFVNHVTPNYLLHEHASEAFCVWGSGQRGFAATIIGTKTTHPAGQLEVLANGIDPETICGECNKENFTKAEIRDIILGQSKRWQIRGVKIERETGSISLILDHIKPTRSTRYIAPRDYTLIPIVKTDCDFIVDFGEHIIHVEKFLPGISTRRVINVIDAKRLDYRIYLLMGADKTKFAHPWFILDYAAP